jgi:hypothetical protein
MGTQGFVHWNATGAQKPKSTQNPSLLSLLGDGSYFNTSTSEHWDYANLKLSSPLSLALNIGVQNIKSN